MAVPGPAPHRVGRHEVADLLRRLDRDGVLAHQELPLGILDLAPQAVHVHRVGHHGVVDQGDPQALPMVEQHRCGIAEGHAVDGPDVARHIAGEVELHAAPRLSLVERAAERVQVGQGQHAPAVAAKAHAGVVQVGARAVDARVHTGAVLGGGVTHRGRRAHVHAGHRPHPRHPRHPRHSGHPRHRRHSHVQHAQVLARVHRRHGGARARTRRQRAAGVAGAVHALREDRVGVVGGTHQHVVGLAGAEAELVHRHRLDLLAVGGHHGELEARDAHVVEGLPAPLMKRRRATLPGLTGAVQLPAGVTPLAR